jgi:8-oxo-dGTP pyrophosphatase MutT (NUDIX family)
MDITFKTEQGRFNYRVCGMIIHNNKILAMHDQRSPYYYLPGGRVKLGETVEEAVLREIREELGIDAKIVRPLWFNQGFFTEDVTGEQFHEICLYFLMDISQTDLLSRGEQFVLNENNQRHTFEWLDFDRLKDEYFYPTFLREKIFNLPEDLTIIANYD